MNEINYEMSLLKYIVNSKDSSIDKDLFTDDRWKFYSIIKDFNIEHNKFPLIESIKEISLEIYKKDISYIYFELDLYEDIDKEVLINKLKKQYKLRKLQNAINIFNRQSDNDNIDNAYEQLISELITVQGDTQETTGSFLYETMPDRLDSYEELRISGKGMLGYKTHLSFIDKHLSGAVGGKFHVFFSLPKVGKSNLLKEIAYNLAVYEDIDVMIISGEMTREELDIITISREAMLDSMLIKNAQLLHNDEERFVESLKKIYSRKDKMYIVDNMPDEFTVEDVISQVLLYYKKFDRMPKVICIDYLNLMGTTKRTQSLTEKLSQIAKDLKHKLAKKYNICVFTATQENREGAKLKRLGKKRGQENVKDSHGITPHVDSLIHLDVPSGEKIIEELKNIMIVSSEINRGGTSFEEQLTYIKEYHYIGDERITIPKIKLRAKREDIVMNDNNNQDYEELI